jgi:transcriptional regulator with XRE-family HTH domain
LLLKAIIKKKNITIKTMLQQLDISSKHLSCIENGHTNPSIELLFTFCQILELEIFLKTKKR